MIGWWIAAALLVIIVVLVIRHRQLKETLRQERSETLRLRDKLSATRQELAEVNTRRKKLLSASTQALIIVEHDFSISSANKVAKRWFGKYKKGATLMSWTRQYQLQDLVEQTLEGEKLPSVYFNRNSLHFEARARSIKSGGEVVAVALAVHDVTELERLSRARRDFVANISHELRTPLASLQLLTETLLGGVLDDDKKMAIELVNKIAAQIDTLNQLAQEVLDLSMIESGKALLRMEPHSLRDIVQSSVDELLPQANRKKLNLQAEISNDITVLVDQTMVRRVIINLLHNAIKFTETGGIMISACKGDEQENGHQQSDDNGTLDWITVSVSDTGIGISPDELPRIFERFYKVDRARKRKGAGTGLGLAIAKHIIEAHGGHIWADSSSSGATFYFTLPSEREWRIEGRG